MRFSKNLSRLLVALAVTSPLVALGQVRPLTIETSKSRVMFESAAKLETINGVSDDVSGRVEFNPADLSASRATVVVPVRSIRTGIKLRDEHLLGEKWLDAEKHPEIRFELTRVEGVSRLEAGQEVSAKLHGQFTVHGVTRPVVANAKLKWTGSAVEVKARFQIKLSDHGVEIPNVVRLKVADEITIRVQLHAS